MERGGAGAWDESLATGSVARAGSRYVMAYTGHFTGETGLAWSEDLFTWRRDPANPVTRPDGVQYGLMGVGHRPMRHWRDPFLFFHEGRWQQLVCANLAGDPTARGVVGRAVSDDWQHWPLAEPLATEAFGEEMECPQIHQRKGKYYLVFSTPQAAILPEWKERLGSDARSAAYVMVAESALGPYRVCAQPALLPPSMGERPYACQIVAWRGRDYCLGTVWHPEGSFLGDPVPVHFTPEGVRTA